MAKIILLTCASLFILSVHAHPKTEHTSSETCDNYIPKSQTQNFTTIDDYQNRSLRRLWKLPNGTIYLRLDVDNATELQWAKCNTYVEIIKYTTNAVDQKWKFGNDVTITFNIAVTNAVNQDWQLRDKWYKYQRTVSNQVSESGTATRRDLQPYKQLIDEWCAINRQYVPSGYCIIYDKL